MRKKWDVISILDKAVNICEIVIALLLMMAVVVKLYDAIAAVAGLKAVLEGVALENVLSSAFSLVIGLEFVRMLCKHTPETVIDVLLFAVARQLVIYNDGDISKLLGIIAIAGLFAVKRFLIGKSKG